MKVLIVDDDPNLRRMLSRVLSRHLNCEAMEAANGLEGLAAIESELPDLVLLDVHMPILDGLATLEAIRASASFRELPVIPISANSEKTKLLRLLELGIADYLLKPVDIKAACARLGRVLEGLAERRASRRRGAAQNGARPRLLLVDPDPVFRAFAKSLVEDRFQVDEASTGAAGMLAYIASRPHVVCIGEGLTLFDPKLLAGAIHAEAARHQLPVTIIFISEDGRLGVEHEGMFDGVLKRSFVAERLLRGLRLALGSGYPGFATLAEVIEREIRPEVVSATQQAIGVLARQEVTTGDSPEADSRSREILVSLELRDPAGRGMVTVAILASRSDVDAIAGYIAGGTWGPADGAQQALGQLIDTIAGRVRAALGQRGFQLEPGSPSVVETTVDQRQAPWGMLIPFRLEGGESFALAIGSRERSAAPTPAPVPESPSAAATAPD